MFLALTIVLGLEWEISSEWCAKTEQKASWTANQFWFWTRESLTPPLKFLINRDATNEQFAGFA